MKCLYVSYDGVLEPLGQSQIIPYLKGLSKKGISFSLLTFEKEYYTNGNQVYELFRDLQRNNINWLNLRYHKKPHIVSSFFDILHGFIVCLVVAMRERPELVHARSYVTSVVALALKKILRLKFIFDMRGFWADERVEGRLWPRKGCLYHSAKFLEKCFLKNADEIIVLTKQARNIIRSWGYSVYNVSVIPCCVDIDSFKYSNNSRLELRKKYNLDEKFIFVHTGSLEYWYMKEEMLNYFRAAKKIEPRAHFLILSHGDKNKIMKLVFEKNLDPGDFTILSVSQADMPKYLAMVDAGLIFITPVFSKMASSPTKFAEYLSCSLPVIINERIGDLEDYVLQNRIGVVIRKFNEAQYAETFKGLLNLLKDENLKFRCRQVACNNFSLDRGVDNYYRIYSRLR